MDIAEARAPSLVIELYLDLTDLQEDETLTLVDDYGKTWDVARALSPPVKPSGRLMSSSPRKAQLILERWTLEVGEISSTARREWSDPAKIYKHCIVLFRALHTYTQLLPAWKYLRRIAKQPPPLRTLKPHYRIRNGDGDSSRSSDDELLGQDTLHMPLYPSSEPVTGTYAFTPLDCPAGSLSISVVYRNDYEFEVKSAETLWNTHFQKMDEGLDEYEHLGRRPLAVDSPGASQVPGSLPARPRTSRDIPDRSQAYGSMSTFHQVGPTTGSSPISTLRAARDNISPSPTASPPQKIPPNHRTAQGSKSSLRSNESGPAFQRRTSVSFQPFKAGSLASSPATVPQVSPSPGSSVGKTSNLSTLTEARNRNSLTNLPQTALRRPSIPNETAIASSASGSPKPAPISRFSSSFSHRRSRLSSGGGSKTEDDNNSSGKASLSSSAQPGSGTLNEGEGGSSGSVQTDDDNLKDFIGLLEQNKELRSLNRTDFASRDASMRRTSAALSKFQRMRDSTSALTDSMSSSLLLHRSSSSSSRQLSSVPPMVAATSLSTSSSPGKPISPHTPHTPHTPAIPSRLSAVDYSEPHRSRSRPRNVSRREDDITQEESASDATSRDGTNAIDIPTSPRQWLYPRRSSSVSQQNRILDDDPDLYGMRSASMPMDDRPDLSLSELLTVNQPLPMQVGDAANDEAATGTQITALPSDHTEAGDVRGPTSTARRIRLPRTISPLPPFSSDTSIDSPAGSSRGGGASASERHSRYRLDLGSVGTNDEEPLLFDMSEVDQQARRSTDRSTGGSSGAGSDGRRGRFARR